MMGVAILLLVIANAAWLYACMALMFTQQQWLSWLPILSDTFIPRQYVTHAMLIAFASQLILLMVLYGMTAHGNLLRKRYKKIRDEKKELKAQTKESEKQRKETEEASHALEQQNAALASKVEKFEEEKQEERRAWMSDMKDQWAKFLKRFRISLKRYKK